MSYQKHCPGCFRRKDGNPVCAHCGYDEAAPRSPLFLPHGSVLAGQYRVGKVLGRPGGFGITYLGWDIYLQQRVAIKEYLPPDMAARVPDAAHITVHTAEDRKNFDAGKDQFLREARIVARLDHPNVVRVRAFFNANDTAYMVMDYYEGMSLDAYFGQVKPTLEMAVAGPLVQMVLDGLGYVHERGVVHRDVKPHNIYLAAIGKPILLDFGAARKHAVGHQRSISVVLTEGYAPLEQYQRQGVLGPWTDIYGTAATLYRMLAGRAPPVAIDRLQRDTLETDGYVGIPEPLKAVLRKALALQVGDRYQSAAEFRAAIGAAMGAASAVVNAGVGGVDDNLAAMARETPGEAADELLPETTRRSVADATGRARIEASPGRAGAPLPGSAGTGLSAAGGDLLAAAALLPAHAAPTFEPVGFGRDRAGVAGGALDRPSPAASPEGGLRTRTATVPRVWLARWVLPLSAGAVALALLAGRLVPASWIPFGSAGRGLGSEAVEAAARRGDTLAERLRNGAGTVEAGTEGVVAVAGDAAEEDFRAGKRPRFRLDGLPALPETIVPALRGLPAGAYARAGTAVIQLPAFRIAETEVTVRDFELFVRRTGYANPAWARTACDGATVPDATWQNPGYAQAASHPVICVDFTDASAYAAWLSQETARYFRLPTEAEWEYAAAAGSATNYWWGNQIDAEHAACADCGRAGETPSRPFLAQSLGQNAFGLYGTAGNVREWTCSAAVAPVSQACGPEPTLDPAADAALGARVLRGGSWHDPSLALATTYRLLESAGVRNTWTGFRIVEDLNR